MNRHGKELMVLVKELQYAKNMRAAAYNEAVAHLAIRRQDAERHVERLQRAVQTAQAAFTAKDREHTELTESERAARGHCERQFADLGLDYDSTASKATIEESQVRTPDEVSADLPLPFGPSLKSKLIDILSWVLTAAGFCLVTVQFSLDLRGLRIVAGGVRIEPVLFLAAVAGSAMIVLAAVVVLRRVFGLLGQKVGSLKPWVGIAVVAGLVLLAVGTAWAWYDARLFHTLSEARAQARGVAGMDWTSAAVVGALIGGLTTASAAAAGFAAGYTESAKSLIASERQKDWKSAVQKAVVKEALAALSSHVAMARNTLPASAIALKQAKATLVQAEAERKNAEDRVPKIPGKDFTVEEQKQLLHWDQEIRSRRAKIAELEAVADDAVFSVDEEDGPPFLMSPTDRDDDSASGATVQ